jgi:hypothetical protein
VFFIRSLCFVAGDTGWVHADFAILLVSCLVYAARGIAYPAVSRILAGRPGSAVGGGSLLAGDLY